MCIQSYLLTSLYATNRHCDKEDPSWRLWFKSRLLPAAASFAVRYGTLLRPVRRSDMSDADKGEKAKSLSDQFCEKFTQAVGEAGKRFGSKGTGVVIGTNIIWFYLWCRPLWEHYPSWTSKISCFAINENVLTYITLDFMFGFAMFFWIMTMWSFFVIVLTSPITPKEILAQEDTREFDNECEPCGFAKPARGNHCRQCDSCVMKHDHHCMWLANCIGLGNYNVYFLFVFYGAILHYFMAAMVLLGGAYPVYHGDFTAFAIMYTPLWHIAISVPLVLLLAFLLLFFGSLTKLHVQLLFSGKTCREYYLNNTTLPLSDDKWQNFREVFSHNIFFCGFPWPNRSSLLGQKNEWRDQYIKKCKQAGVIGSRKKVKV